jgi:subtilisin family serine protease
MDGKKFFVGLCFFVLLHLSAAAQQKYWIYLNDKNAPFNISQLSIDLPDSIALGKKYIYPVLYSEWLNAISAPLSVEEEKYVNNLPEVDSVVAQSRNYYYASTSAWEPTLHSHALEQINAHAMLESGLDGSGVKIGIIDAGFYRANKQRALKEIIRDGRMKGYRNYIEKSQQVPYAVNDSHGTRVWKLIGGYMPSRDTYYGLAPKAEYYIARTDEDPAEYRAEEDHWIAAMEWMYKQGVRVINSSLGYSDGHDDPREDYLPAEANGNSTAMTRVVNMAVYEKGLLIIMSAGNSGDEPFSVVNIPADSPGVIAVGATKMNTWLKQEYSSIGRYTLPVIKPDVACYSGNGTSFSAPVITGLAACIMQSDSTLSNLEIAELIKKSCNLRYYPNNYIGFGIPDALRIIDMLENEWALPENSSKIIASGSSVEVALEAINPVLFHKLNSWEVIEQVEIDGVGKLWKIHRPDEKVRQTTFSTSDEAIEIIWPR